MKSQDQQHLQEAYASITKRVVQETAHHKGMNNTNQSKYHAAVTAAALGLVETPGMTLDRLQQMHDEEVQAGMSDEVSKLYRDAIAQAIEMMTNPMFD